MLFINNIMTCGDQYIEYFLEKSLYSNLIDVFQNNGDFKLKKECVFFWCIVENYGNEEQKLVIEQDIFINLFNETLEIEDEELILTILQTLECIFSRHLDLIQYLDTDVIDEIEFSENDEIHSIISTLHEMYEKYDED